MSCKMHRIHRANDPVDVAAYEPSWQGQFERLRDRAAAALGDVIIGIEHVGSTAVPGLIAKPVIDLDVIVRSSADAPAAIDRLGSIRYRHEGDLGITGREAFVWQEGEPPTIFYVCAAGSEALRDHLLFRDYLRIHPEEARRYADVKAEAAREFPFDRHGYAAVKRQVVEEILTRAQRSATID